MDTDNLSQYYQILGLSPDASPEAIQDAYLLQVATARKKGEKELLESLKTAYQVLWDYSLQHNYDQAQAEPQNQLARLINDRLKPYHLQAILQSTENNLYLIFDAAKVTQKRVPLSFIKPILEDLNLPNINTVKVMGKREGKTIFWKYHFSLIEKPKITETERLLKKAEDNTRIWGFPIALIIALSLNITGLNWLWNIWIHEFGHATLAWFSGYRALPTLAITIMADEKSLFVYGGILFLLGLLFWSGKKEQKPWTMGIAIGLILIQFYMTWMMNQDTYDRLQAFGGVGSEFYLSTFLMVCFYFQLPEKLHWDLWRYLVLVIAMSTFLNNFTLWNRINKGQTSIPWGTFWGGEGDGGGDMNTLNEYYYWSSDRIIETYRTLGHFCLWILIGVYLYFLIQSSPRIRKILGIKKLR